MRRLIAACEGVAVYGVLPALALLVAADVVLRYFFNLPLRWGNDVKTLLLLIAVVAGLPGASYAGEHIRVGLLDRVIAGAAGALWQRVRHVLTALVGIAIAYALAALAWDMHRYAERAEMVDIPFWPFAALAAMAAALSAVAEVARALASPRGGG